MMEQYALITGASGGIGAALAFKFAKEGYNLVLIGRDTSKLDLLSYIITRTLEVNILTYKVELSSDIDVKRFIAKLAKVDINITVFINNAGIGSFGEFKTIDTARDLDIIDVNVRASTLLLKEILPLLGDKAHILQVASTAAFTPGPYMAVYYASKAYALSLAIALRHELRSEHIRVSVLCPGPTTTNFQSKAGMNKADFTKFVALHPIKVANIAYKGMRANKPIIVTGVVNKATLHFMNLVPYSHKATLTAQTQRSC